MAIGNNAALRAFDVRLALDESIRLDPTDALAHKERGRIHNLKGDIDAAIIDYTQAISLKSDMAELYYRRALIWLKKRDHANAQIDLTECLRLAPNNNDALVAHGHALIASDPDRPRPDHPRWHAYRQSLRLARIFQGAEEGLAERAVRL